MEVPVPFQQPLERPPTRCWAQLCGLGFFAQGIPPGHTSPPIHPTPTCATTASGARAHPHSTTQHNNYVLIDATRARERRESKRRAYASVLCAHFKTFCPSRSSPSHRNPFRSMFIHSSAPQSAKARIERVPQPQKPTNTHPHPPYRLSFAVRAHTLTAPRVYTMSARPTAYRHANIDERTFGVSAVLQIACKRSE